MVQYTELIVIADDDLQYQLELKAVALRDLCFLWQTKVRPIPPAYSMSESWGPSEAELREAAAAANYGSWIDVDLDDQLGREQPELADDSIADDVSVDDASSIGESQLDSEFDIPDDESLDDYVVFEEDNEMERSSSECCNIGTKRQRTMY